MRKVFKIKKNKIKINRREKKVAQEDQVNRYTIAIDTVLYIF